MSAYGGTWIASTDKYGRPCWLDRFTGRRSFNVPKRSPFSHHTQQTLEPQHFHAIVPQQAMSPPYSPYSPPFFVNQGYAGTNPPPMTLPTTRWTGHYYNRGKPQHFDAIVPQQVMSPPYSPYTPPFFANQGYAGTSPPPMAIPNTRWTEHYDNRGKKYWTNNLTDELTLKDPFF